MSQQGAAGHNRRVHSGLYTAGYHESQVVLTGVRRLVSASPTPARAQYLCGCRAARIDGSLPGFDGNDHQAAP